MKLEELKPLVIEEATKLKAILTPKEKSKLDFYKLDSNSRTNCIYGQITGYCFNRGAIELINSLNITTFFKYAGYSCEENAITKNKIENKLQYDDYNIHRPERAFTPMEHFIAIKGEENPNRAENNKRLIAFLKDETQTLEFI